MEVAGLQASSFSLKEDFCVSGDHRRNHEISSSSHFYQYRCSVAQMEVTESSYAVECPKSERLGMITEKKKRQKTSYGPESNEANIQKESLDLEQLLGLLDEGKWYPSVHELLHILYKCRAAKEPCHVLRFYDYLCARRLETHPSLGNYLVLTLAEFGILQDALEIFNGLHYRDERTWNSLITGFVKSGDVDHAFVLYTQMCADRTVTPNKHTIAALLKGCARLQDLKRGCQLHRDIKSIGQYTINEFIGSALIDMYAKCGAVQKAQDVFDELPNSDVVTWNALIGGYASQGYPQQAFDCFEQMQIKGVLPNAVTFVCIFKACASINGAHIGDELHSHILKLGLLEENVVIGNSIIDMYAKRGCLTTARFVFDHLVIHDVLSWTSIIHAYTNAGLNEEALSCFSMMELDGVSPNAVTYTSCLKACANMEAVSLGEKIHFELVCKGFDKQQSIGTALVGMYAKCGVFDVAQELFNTLIVQDVVSWNALIVGYMKYDYPADALRCYKSMQANCVSPDAVTLVCCLNACGRTKAVDKGKELHAEIAGRGIMEQDILIGNALVDMYATCGLLKEAEGVLHRLPLRTAVTWNALINGYAEQGRGEEALKCLRKMQIDGVHPDSMTFVWCLGVCGSMRNLEQGQELHNEASSRGYTRDYLVRNALVYMFCKCGSVERAEEVFSNTSNRDIVCWTSLIVGYVELGYSEKALACFKQMQNEAISPDALAFAYILRACGNAQENSEGLKLHAQLIGEGCLEDVVVIDAGVYMYAKCGCLVQAQRLFDSLTSRDVVSWNILIGGYSEHFHEERALMCFQQMLIEGVRSISSTYVSLLKLNRPFRSPSIIKQLYAMAVKEGVDTERTIGCALVNAFSKSGLLAEAKDVFKKTPTRDEVTWTSLMAAYVEHEQGEEALHCLQFMKQEGFPLDVTTFACSLQACGNIGAIHKGQELHDQIQREGLLQDENILARVLIDMYAKCGLIEKATHIFDKLQDRNVIAWSTLIAGSAQFGKFESVLHLVNRMTAEGKQPNRVTYLSLLNACAHSGMIAHGQMYFQCMEINHGVVATLEHYNCVVDLLSRAGQVEEALEVIENSSFNGNYVVRQTLLTACQKLGHIDLRKDVYMYINYVERINQYASSFASMSKMYADATH